MAGFFIYKKKMKIEILKNLKTFGLGFICGISVLSIDFHASNIMSFFDVFEIKEDITKKTSEHTKVYSLRTGIIKEQKNNFIANADSKIKNSKYLKAQIFKKFQDQEPKNLNVLPLNLESKIIKNKKYTFVIAPHPDDEILCCGRTLIEKIKKGANVKIIYFTNGDAFSKNKVHSIAYGETRRAESIKAAKMLGLKNKDLFFLDFPDGSLEKLNNKYAVSSDFTGRNASEEDGFMALTPYTRPHLENLVEDIFKKFPPSEVYIPDEKLDDHLDHQMASIVTQKVLKKLIQQKKIKTYIYKYMIHNSRNYKMGKYKDLEKLKLIQVFKSQYHTPKHKTFLENFSTFPENFEKIDFLKKNPQKS